MDLDEIGFHDEKLTQNSTQWRAYVNTVMN